MGLPCTYFIPGLALFVTGASRGDSSGPGMQSSARPVRLSLSFLALLSLLAPLAAEGSCGTASCPLHLSNTKDEGGPHSGRGLSMQFTFEHIEQNRLRFGSEVIRFGEISRPAHDELATTNRNADMRIVFALNSRWSMSLMLPVVSRTHSHILAPGHVHSGDGGVERWDFTEIGDLSLQTRFRSIRVAEEGSDWAVGFGVGLPTGSTRVQNAEGRFAEPSLQPGSGAFSLLLDACYRVHLRLPMSAEQLSMWTFSSTLRLHTRSERDYLFGNEWRSHIGIHHSMHRLPVDLLGQIVVRWQGQDDAGPSTHELVDATGGTDLYVSPGLNLKLGGDLTTYGYYLIPLYQYVNEVQLTAGSNIVVGLRYSLSL